MGLDGVGVGEVVGQQHWVQYGWYFCPEMVDVSFVPYYPTNANPLCGWVYQCRVNGPFFPGDLGVYWSWNI